MLGFHPEPTAQQAVVRNADRASVYDRSALGLGDNGHGSILVTGHVGQLDHWEQPIKHCLWLWLLRPPILACQIKNEKGFPRFQYYYSLANNNDPVSYGVWIFIARKDSLMTVFSYNENPYGKIKTLEMRHLRPNDNWFFSQWKPAPKMAKEQFAKTNCT